MFLNCHSFHSLRYGTLSIEELVKQAYESGSTELVLTDINTITGIYDFKKECERVGIKPMAGVEVRKEGKLLYIAVAKEFSGIGEVNTIITQHNCDGMELSETALEFDNVFVVYPMSNIPETLKENERIGVRIEELNFLIRPEYQKLISRMVVLHPVTFRTDEEYKLHKILRAIDHNTLLSKITKRDVCRKSEYFITGQEIVKAFERYPEIVKRTKELYGTRPWNFILG
jgi:DNA polymerase-3 subunit alpha